MADYKTYFSSLVVFGKVSEINAKAIFKAIKSSVKYEELPREEIDKFIEASRPLKREIDNGKYSIMLDAMIVNNEIANKSISLPEQKVITSSNYKTEIPQTTLTRSKLATTRNIIRNLPTTEPVSFNYDTINDIIFRSNIEINELDNIGEIENWQKEGFETNRKFLVMTSQGLLEGQNEVAESFIEGLINDEGSHLGNYIIYRNGESIIVKPPKGVSYVDVSQVTAKYIGNLSNFKNKKTNKPGFGGAGATYTNNKFTKAESYYESKLNKTSIKRKALEVSNVGSGNQNNKTRKRNNIFIEDMLKAGPNIYTNMFDIYFRFNNVENGDDGSNKETVGSYLYFVPITVVDTKGKANINNSLTQVESSTFNNVYSLSVRTASVNIPLRNRESTAFKFLNTEVERPVPMVSQNLEGTLSIDCDANAYVYDMFLALAGLQRNGQIKTSDGQITYINNSLYDRTSNHYPFMAPAKLGHIKKTVDIVVASHSLSMWSDKSVNPSYGGYYSNLVFVFKDVRFLGVGNALQFNTENSGSQACDVNFIAKELETYFKPDNMDYMGYNTNVVRSSIFNAKNRYGNIYDENSITERTEPDKEDDGMKEDEKDNGELLSNNEEDEAEV